MKKLICLLTALLLMISMFGCGKQEAHAANAGEADTAVKAEETAKAENNENKQENIIALDGWKDEETRSVVFTYDNTQLEVWDEDYYNTSSIELVKIGDPTSILEIACEAMTLEEIQAEIADVDPDRYEVSEFAESTFAGFPAWSCDIFYKDDGSIRESFFIIEISNGLYLMAEGYDGTIPLEEMLSYALLTVEEGDGTVILPPLGFVAENDDDKLTVSFDSGDSFTLDYIQNAVNVYYDGKNAVEIFFADETLNDLYHLECYLSDQYATFEDYLYWQQELGYYYSDNPAIQQASLAGMELQYVSDEWGGGYYFIPITDTFALRGGYYYHGEEQSILTIVDIWEIIMGTTAEGESTVQSSSNTPATNAAVYDYNTPAALEDTLESMTYAIDGVVYRFPTPVIEFLNNGWHIPEDLLQEGGMEIPANDYREIALTQSDGSIIYNVLLFNPTDAPINIADGIVTYMIIAKDSNVDFQLPEGLSLDSTIEDLDAACDNNPVNSDDYANYSWWTEDSDDGIIAWYHPEIGLEYFEFASW